MPEDALEGAVWVVALFLRVSGDAVGRNGPLFLVGLDIAAGGCRISADKLSSLVKCPIASPIQVRDPASDDYSGQVVKLQIVLLHLVHDHGDVMRGANLDETVLGDLGLARGAFGRCIVNEADGNVREVLAHESFHAFDASSLGRRCRKADEGDAFVGNVASVPGFGEAWINWRGAADDL